MASEEREVDFDAENEDEDQDLTVHHDPVFYVYTGVGSQSVVFKRQYGEFAQEHGDEATQKEQIEEQR